MARRDFQRVAVIHGHTPRHCLAAVYKSLLVYK
jgi:hypothetical protein